MCVQNTHVSCSLLPITQPLLDKCQTTFYICDRTPCHFYHFNFYHVVALEWVGGLSQGLQQILCSSCPHVEVSLSKTSNPKFPSMRLCGEGCESLLTKPYARVSLEGLSAFIFVSSSNCTEMRSKKCAAMGKCFFVYQIGGRSVSSSEVTLGVCLRSRDTA